MRFALRALILVAALLTLPELVQAQPCPHPFKANTTTSSSYIEYCVSDNANITDIKTPFDVRQSGFYEGYGLCQESPIVAYYDYSSSTSGNWSSAQLLNVSGGSIKIRRSTADGNWTLVQTISQITATGGIKIVMALTNNQSVAKTAYLLRWIQPHSSLFQPHSAGASFNGAWSWENSFRTFHYGLQLSNAAKSPFAYRQGFVGWALPPNPCDFAGATYPSGVQSVTFNVTSLSYVYAGPVPAGATRTVTLNYRGS